MKSWREGQVAWRLLNIKDEVEESYGNELNLGGPYEGYKNISWGMEMYFYHLWIFLWHLESISFPFAQWVHTCPASEPISREWDSHPSWPWERPFRHLIWTFIYFFNAYIRLLLFVTHLSSHSLKFHFHVSMFFHEGALVWMVVAPHWVQLITKNGWMIPGSVIFPSYSM